MILLRHFLTSVVPGRSKANRDRGMIYRLGRTAYIDSELGECPAKNSRVQFKYSGRKLLSALAEWPAVLLFWGHENAGRARNIKLNNVLIALVYL